MFKSVLIANRGEIAVRIARTLKDLGVRSVGVASIPDRRSLAARSVDRCVLLDGYSAAETYLDIEAIISAARAEGCAAIHPGYGFLSERADFAERCAAEGIVFVGPSPAVLRGLGDKAAARQLAVAHGVPVVPGWDGADDDETLLREAASIGFPVMLKARGGGGGRGMREVFSAEALPEAIESARREALSAFGDGGLLLEKLVTDAHHVEVQVLADTHGNIVHLGERDCSVQRRHQKLIEETPSPVVDAALRERLTAYALTLARAIHYTNAGTFEFLVAGTEIYFLEVNPRLQVEHPVTEMVTGLDLVELQLRVAAGETLPLRQQGVRFEGHAIEFRVNAEDPWDGFKPGAGRLQVLWDDATRADSGFEEGDNVPSQYDSLLLKRIFHADTRAEAVAHAEALLGADDVLGVRTNLGLLRAVVAAPDFAAGRCTIDWLERHLDDLLEGARTPAPAWIAAAAALAERGHRPSSWLGAGRTALWLTDGIETRKVELASGSAWLDGEPHSFARTSGGSVSVDGGPEMFEPLVNEPVPGHPASAAVPHDIYLVPPPPLPRRALAAVAGSTAIVAPLAGTIVAVAVAEADAVSEGQLLVTLEAMKMEHRVVAPAAGTVRALYAAERAVVSEGDLLLELG